ncbi:PAP2 family phosphoesterase [Bombiscardovia nodaiensis]|uniref:PAP2 family phosphoesterase n=1 Tax=Bombiscardovia nodaiensis TaxID=2932181 RepID=A0ABM8B6X2_9BIFI|nr:PAP2 family phosphoesterase [Bombiscardovia nodaiensis]
MSSWTRRARRWVTLGMAGIVALTCAAPAQAASESNPLVPLVEDFGAYWQAPGQPYDGSGTPGKVLNAKILQQNDKTLVDINHAGAKGMQEGKLTDQQKRALSDRDADRNVAFEMKDGFGPVLGAYFEEGYNSGSLDLVKEIMNANGWSGNPSKDVHQFPRPYTQRGSWLPDAQHIHDGHNDLVGLPDTLDIITVPDAVGADGKQHSPDYPKNSIEGSFPSGHTNKAYSRGVVLAAMVPELAPEILTRISEAGNNRLVLGVHYPLDVVAGRIGGMASVAAYWQANSAQMEAARDQLRTYLETRCKQDGHGDTLAAAISKLGADNAKGYQNSFTDPISTQPVTDRASALKAYRARMTYGFTRSTTTDQPLAAPENADLLLSFAYPKLTAAQRKEVLAQTAIASGYPYDKSSKGWGRINLARALSARVTLNSAGKVVKVQDALKPSVIQQAAEAPAASKPSRSALVWALVAVAALVLLVCYFIIFKRRQQHQ